ncbi:hypothetical protein LTR85_009200 [Meristemomyces frigidus]|nr:hypothetical protein LTR85_009200 [Meristemomyces frigidus]
MGDVTLFSTAAANAKDDWQRHRAQCHAARSGLVAHPATRTTMRLNMASFLQDRQSGGAENRTAAPAGTIYYLQTSTPHLYDVSVSGPYHSVDAIVPQAMQNFGDDCRSGQGALRDLVRDGMFADAEHITSPINNDPNRTKTLRILKEHNPTMAARLPGPARCIIVAEVATDQMDNALHTGRVHVPVKDMRVHGTFESEVLAKAAAQRVAEELATRTRRGRVIAQPEGATGAFAALVVGQSSNGSQTKSMVHVRYDAGTLTPPSLD